MGMQVGKSSYRTCVMMQTRSTLRRAHAAMRTPLPRDLIYLAGNFKLMLWAPISKRGVRDNQGTKTTLSLGSKPATVGF